MEQKREIKKCATITTQQQSVDMWKRNEHEEEKQVAQ